MSTSMKKAFSIAGIFVGLIVLVVGLNLSETNTNTRTTIEEAYGGDAYTGIQNSTADVSNNVKEAVEMIQKGFSYLICAIGGISICYFGNEFVKIDLMEEAERTRKQREREQREEDSITEL